MTRPVFRFAPSPNGELHLGHAYSALLNARLARETGGRLLLRIEDIDIGRCTPEFEEAIYRDLAWLGIEWEEPVRRQSEHFADYAEALHRLIDAGLAEDMAHAATVLTIVSMAALGLGIDLRRVMRAGPRVTAAVVLSLCVLGVVSYGMVVFLNLATA